MTSKAFLLRLAAIVVVVTAGAVSLNVWLDLYGLFRGGRGRNLKVYGEERNCKYLFSYRYLPENFDALMLGSSVSDNIPVKTVGGLRIYNASLNGGVITEAKNLGTIALRRGHFRLLLLSLHRYMMESAGEKTNFMVPQRYWGALGSMQLYTASFSYLMDRAGIRHCAFDSNGAQAYGPSTPKTRRDIAKIADQFAAGQGYWKFSVNPKAFQDLKDLIGVAHERGAIFVAFTPPMPTPMQKATSHALAEFDNEVRKAFGADDVFIDMNQPAYYSISDDYDNFREAAHLSDRGAQLVADELDRTVAGILARQAHASSR